MKLYHYTDVNAVKSILEKQELWLTDVRFLNDTEELNSGISTLKEFLSRESVLDRVDPEHSVSAMEQVVDRMNNRLRYGLDSNPMFLCSFSRAQNLLSQWRAYGSYAIEFSAEAISHPLSECIYDQSNKSKLAFHASVDSLQRVARDMRGNDGRWDQDGYDAYAELLRLAATFKHESFHEEQEFRVIVGERDDHELDVKFRARGDLLVPYVALKVPFASIKAIHVGPMKNQELAFSSIQAFVQRELWKYWEETGDYDHSIRLERSEIPYRSG